MNNLPYDTLQSVREYLPASDKRNFKQLDKAMYSFASKRYPQSALRNEDILSNLKDFQSLKPTIQNTPEGYLEIQFNKAGKITVRVSMTQQETQFLVYHGNSQFGDDMDLQIHYATLSMYYILSMDPNVLIIPFSLYFQIPIYYRTNFLGIISHYKLVRFNWDNARYFIAYNYTEYIIDTLDSSMFDMKQFKKAIVDEQIKAPTIPEYAYKNMSLEEKNNLLSKLIQKLDYFQIATQGDFPVFIEIQGSIQGYKFQATQSLTARYSTLKLTFYQNNEPLTYVEAVVQMDGENFINNVDDNLLRTLLLPDYLDVGLVLYVCLLQIDVFKSTTFPERGDYSFDVSISMLLNPITFERYSLAKEYFFIFVDIYDLKDYFESYSIEYLNQIVQKRIAFFDLYKSIKFDHHPGDDYIMDNE